MKVKIRGLVFAGFAAAVFAQSASAEITNDDKTVTSKTYVDTNFQNIVQKDKATGAGTTASPYATTINANSSNDTYPTSQNVYKFVTDQMDDLAEVAAIKGDDTYLNVTEVTVTPAQGDPYRAKQVEVITNNLASTAALIGTAGTSAQAADQGKLTTAKAVYDFVTTGDPNDPNSSGFQRKLTTSEASNLENFNYDSSTQTYGDSGRGVMIGYRGTGANADSTWYIFGAKPNGDGTNNDNHLSYLKIEEEIGSGANAKPKFLVDLKDNALAKNATAISDAGVGGAALITTDKLTTAKAVYDYAAQKDWGTGNAGKHLVIGLDGKVTVSTNANPDIPLPTNCATGTNVCALVAHLNSAGTGIEYEWTVMAGTGN